MFRPIMATEEKQLATITQTGPIEVASPVGPSPDAVALKERDHRRYEFVCEHGRGGIGRVMRTRDLDLGREVAIKEILDPGGIGEARFVREAMITAQLEHPGIVPLYDAGRWPNGTPFYSMKLVSGRPLKHLIGDAKTLDARLALLTNVMAVADAMAYAHDRGIIHRDLKPSNIIVGHFGETIVIDWGLAKKIGEKEPSFGSPAPVLPDDVSDMTAIGAVVGTPAFMPPEQASGAPADERSDVYAIGAILYNVLSGEPPYSGRTTGQILAKLASAAPEELSMRDPTIPSELCAVVHKAMAREPRLRYSDASSLAADLRRFVDGQLVSAHDYSASALLKRWIRRHRVLLIAALTGLIAAGGTTAASMSRILESRNVASRSALLAARRSDQLQVANKTIDDKAHRLILEKARAEMLVDPPRAIVSLAAYGEGHGHWGETRQLAAEAARAGLPAWSLQLADAPGVIFSHDGHEVVIADGSTVRFLNSDTGTVLHTIKTRNAAPDEGSGFPTGLAWVDDQTVALSRLGGTIWFVTHVKARALSPGCGQIRSLKANVSSVYLACEDGRVLRVSPQTLSVTEEGTRHLQAVTALDVYRDRVISVSRDGTLHATQAGHTWTVKLMLDGSPVVVKSSKGDTIAVGSSHGEVLLVNPNNKSQRVVRRHSVKRILDLAFLDAPERLVSTSLDGVAVVDGIVDSKLDRVMPDAWRFASLNDGTLWITASESGTMTISDPRSGWERHIHAHADSVAVIEVASTGYIATGSDSGEIRVWSPDLYPRSTFNLLHPVDGLADADSQVVANGHQKDGSPTRDLLMQTIGNSDHAPAHTPQHSAWQELDASHPLRLDLAFGALLLFKRAALIIGRTTATYIPDLGFEPVSADYSNGEAQLIALGFLEREMQVLDLHGCATIYPTAFMSNIVKLVDDGRGAVAFDDFGRGSYWRVDNAVCLPTRSEELADWLRERSSAYTLHN
jgi:serine/threonine protein kinase/WD40 repeat protein